VATRPIRWQWLAVAALLGAPPAAADDPTKRGFDADPVRPAFSLDGGFAVETAGAVERGRWGLAAVLDAAGGLLVADTGAGSEDLLQARLSLHLLAGWSLGPVELAAHLPTVLHQWSDLTPLTDQGVTGPLVEPIPAAALGDLRLGAKVPLLRAERWPIGLAALADLRLPTGDPQAFSSDGLAFMPSLVATWPHGKLRVDAQAGYLFREPGQYGQLVVQDSFNWGLGGSLDLPPLGRLERWRALLELTGAVPRGFDASGERYRAPLSARAGARAWLSPSLAVELGGGAGLGEPGYGHERWRVFAGVRWTGRPPGPPEDPDRDGITGARDLCPDEPGPAELDGCPDRDGDAIPDREDRCPSEPGPAEREGCPPPEAEPLVEIEAKRLSLKDSIHFDTAKDTIKPESLPVLDQVASVLVEHTELRRLRVEGHTDNVGSAPYNKDLSARRAASVVRYLTGKGVAPGRLVPAGYGFDRPVASNDTALGRAKNRRVEFTIVDEGGAPSGQ
jgi:outer membrane protein OmpA-like peptidoglycan-associated protein